MPKLNQFILTAVIYRIPSAVSLKLSTEDFALHDFREST